MATPRNIPRTGLNLQYPMSLGVYDGYPQAQHVVDYLADHDFPVQNVEIVGTELRSIVRVTGRLTRGKVAMAGDVSGLCIAVFVGVAFALFSNQGQLVFLLNTSFLA